MTSFWYYYGPWPPSTFLYKSTLTQQKYCMPRTRFAYHIAYRGVHLHTVELHMHTIFRDQHTNLHTIPAYWHTKHTEYTKHSILLSIAIIPSTPDGT